MGLSFRKRIGEDFKIGKLLFSLFKIFKIQQTLLCHFSILSFICLKHSFSFIFHRMIQHNLKKAFDSQGGKINLYTLTIANYGRFVEKNRYIYRERYVK